MIKQEIENIKELFVDNSGVRTALELLAGFLVLIAFVALI